ncbi:MAG: hypothetical protein HON47_05355 [Candidatus Diapherotrites archaeon]|jgi:hypothetical protein|uniref:Uncharacterized protein n=1 Tax=Candidatus Iainarchaeum sp. TaxID=3101447 RepID=A0A8T5GG53_9ARCH|nr:hypothetical protein [Candidatus Diapherotrites archaeon]
MLRFNFKRFRRKPKPSRSAIRPITNPTAITDMRKIASAELSVTKSKFESSGKWTDILTRKEGQRAYELLEDHDLKMQLIGNKKAADEINRVRELIKLKLERLNNGTLSPTQFRREVKSALQGLNLKLI